MIGYRSGKSLLFIEFTWKKRCYTMYVWENTVQGNLLTVRGTDKEEEYVNSKTKP